MKPVSVKGWGHMLPQKIRPKKKKAIRWHLEAFGINLWRSYHGYFRHSVRQKWNFRVSKRIVTVTIMFCFIWYVRFLNQLTVMTDADMFSPLWTERVTVFSSQPHLNQPHLNRFWSFESQWNCGPTSRYHIFSDSSILVFTVYSSLFASLSTSCATRSATTDMLSTNLMVPYKQRTPHYHEGCIIRYKYPTFCWQSQSSNERVGVKNKQIKTQTKTGRKNWAEG